MKRILAPNNQKCFLVLTGVPSNNYPLYLRKKEISFPSHFNQFTGNNNLVRCRPSFNEIEMLMEYRQSPDKESALKEVKNLETIIKVVRKNKKYYPTKNTGIWIAALSIILIVVLAAIIRRAKVSEASRVYKTFFTLPSPNFEHDQTSITFYSNLNNAVALYQAGNFPNANDFSHIPLGSGYSDVALFYKGICYMALNQFDKAIETFGSISSTSDISTQTKYYSGLCNLKLNRINAARVIFSELTISEEWAKNATEILLKLESID